MPAEDGGAEPIAVRALAADATAGRVMQPVASATQGEDDLFAVVAAPAWSPAERRTFSLSGASDGA
jgi:hypothetical protein